MTTENNQSGPEPEQSGAKAKVLAIGCTGFAGVECVEWFSRDVPNAADFDIVVVDGVRLSEIIRQERGEKDTPLPQIKRWRAWQDKLRERLRNLVKTRGIVLAIVNELTVAVGRKPEEPMKGWPVIVSSRDWIPLPIMFHAERGQTKSVKQAPFKRYIKLVGSWTFYLQVDPDDSGGRFDELREAHGYDHIEVTLQPIAVNRQQLPIAATATYSVHETNGGRWKTTPHLRSGSLHLLPPPTSGSVHEALGILLEDLCGLEAPTPEPEFAQRMRVPGEDELDAQITRKSQQLARVQQDIDAISAEKARKRRFLALTYEKGIQGLQHVAQQAFEEMGLKAWDADPEVSDEFMIGDGASEALVEVKGHRKGAQKQDIRQLDESLDEYERKFSKAVKGILVVNAWCEMPVEARDQPQTQSFPDNVVKRARAIDAALVSGVELYNALCAVWEGRLTGQAIFSQLMKGRGVTKLTGP